MLDNHDDQGDVSAKLETAQVPSPTTSTPPNRTGATAEAAWAVTAAASCVMTVYALLQIQAVRAGLDQVKEKPRLRDALWNSFHQVVDAMREPDPATTRRLH